MKKLTIIFCLFSVCFSFNIRAQETPKPIIKDTITDMGVAVAPAMVKFTTIPGYSDVKYVTITNDTKKPEKFKISVADYEMNDKGTVKQMPTNIFHEYGISKWITISPSFVELRPGEAKKLPLH